MTLVLLIFSSEGIQSYFLLTLWGLWSCPLLFTLLRLKLALTQASISGLRMQVWFSHALF